MLTGAEYAGVVTEVGAGVSEVSVGDRVFGGAGLGCYAESIVVPSDKVCARSNLLLASCLSLVSTHLVCAPCRL